MAVSILKCPYCSDSIRKSGAYIVGIAVTPAWADERCSYPFGEIDIHKVFLENLLCGAVRTEFERHVIGTIFSTFYNVDLDTSMSANCLAT